MENTFFKYIEYLLPQYNCVIIPNLGGFVVNIEPAYTDENGAIMPPSYKVSFNQDLIYNDGLLASNIHQLENISYESACQQIKRSVEDIRLRLLQDKNIQCGNLGKLIVNDENRFSFIPNNSLIHPSLMGLSSVHIPLLAQLDSEKVKERRSLNLRYVMAGAAAAAVALLLFMGPSINVGNTTDTANRQQANFLNMLSKNKVYTTTSNEIETDVPATTNLLTHVDGNDEFPNTPVNSIEKVSSINSNYESNTRPHTAENNYANSNVTSVSTRTYYIIVGGEESRQRADKLLSKIQSEDFPSANIVESADRYRIYESAFDNKSEAEQYLDNFRAKNPKYKTAWLFSQRNGR